MRTFTVGQHDHRLARQRDQRARTGNAHTRRYEKTKPGFLMRLYRNIQSRVRGIQKQKAHLYSHIEGVPSRLEFYRWANDQSNFHRLFEAWTQSGFDRKITPSVDRLDSQKGYEFNNLEWVTHSENSRRGAKARWGK